MLDLLEHNKILLHMSSSMSLSSEHARSVSYVTAFKCVIGVKFLVNNNNSITNLGFD